MIMSTFMAKRYFIYHRVRNAQRTVTFADIVASSMHIAPLTRNVSQAFNISVFF